MRAGVSTHSRLKAAGCYVAGDFEGFGVSTHSRLKAAGTASDRGKCFVRWFQHTAA